MATDVTSDARSVPVERVMPHPPEKVWRALTQGPLIQEWPMPNDFEPVVGHRFKFKSTPMPHWNGVVGCGVLVVEPNQRLSYCWNASGEEAATGSRPSSPGRRRPLMAVSMCGRSSRASTPPAPAISRAQISAG